MADTITREGVRRIQRAHDELNDALDNGLEADPRMLRIHEHRGMLLDRINRLTGSLTQMLDIHLLRSSNPHLTCLKSQDIGLVNYAPRRAAQLLLKDGDPE